MNLIKFDQNPGWESRFNEYLRSNNRAHDSMRSLVEEGIPQDWLLHVLHDYADPGLRERKQLQHRKTALTSVKGVDRALKMLSGASDALNSLACSDAVPNWVKDFHFNLRRSLFTHLDSYETAMSEVREELAKLASKKGEGVSEEFLAGLVEAVNSVTGQPHWGDLAYPVEGAYFAHSRRLHADRDTIRKRYQRFVKNFPRVHESWVGLDWKTYFGIGGIIEATTSTDPRDVMDHFIKRFSPKSRKRRSTTPRYGKIHRSMKR
jgi:hypothetical protein